MVRLQASVAKEQQAAAAPMSTQIANLKRDIAAKDRAVQSSNAALVKLASGGNAWAKSQLSQKKSAATRGSRAELEKLSSAYTATLSSQSSTLAETQTIINQQNKETGEANQRNREIMAGMYTAMTVCPKLLSIILRVLMVITFFAYSSGVSLDLNGDGVIDYADVEVYYANMIKKRQEREARPQHRPPTAPDFDDIGGGATQPFR